MKKSFSVIPRVSRAFILLGLFTQAACLHAAESIFDLSRSPTEE